MSLITLLQKQWCVATGWLPSEPLECRRASASAWPSVREVAVGRAVAETDTRQIGPARLSGADICRLFVRQARRNVATYFGVPITPVSRSAGKR